MPRRRRVYILRIEDYLVDPSPPPSRLPRILLTTALSLLLCATLALAFAWLFSLIPHSVIEIAIAVLFAYALILALFIALAQSINHVE
jgi:membrane protein YdbS with pleckstrin-like domain